MANEVCSSMGLIGKDLSGKLIHVVEEHGSNTGFMIGSMIWNAINSETTICLLTLHNSFQHYENLSKKLGYSLKIAIENRNAVVLDPFHMYPKLTSKCNTVDMVMEELLQGLLSDINETLCSFSGRKLLVIDNLSDLMALGASLPALVQFLQCCRSLQLFHKELGITICTHLSKNSDNEILLSNFVAHNSDCRITIAGLKTGFSSDITGNIKVDNFLEDNNELTHRGFHYKLTDRNVMIFAPGTIGIHG